MERSKRPKTLVSCDPMFRIGAFGNAPPNRRIPNSILTRASPNVDPVRRYCTTFKEKCMISKPTFMRPSFKRNWDGRKIAEEDRFNFLREAKLYLQHDQYSRDPAYRNCVDKILQQMFGYAGQTIVSAIPCHANENPDIATLSRHVTHVGSSGGHVIVFINAGSLELEAAANALFAKLAKSLRKNCSQAHYTLVVLVFDEPQTIGKIRKILNDAIILRFLELKASDPIIISNDVDCCYTPPGYIDTIRKYFSDPCLDILSGPLYYGYTHLGDDYLGIEPGVPELFLGNRVLEARRICRLNGDFFGEPFFTTEGPHTVFRASAYCAAGGYDASLEQAEDDEMGIAIFALRQKGCFPFPTARNAVYANDFWLVTNPRRQLLAIANGISIVDTWQKFPIKEVAGHRISLQTESLDHKNARRIVGYSELLNVAKNTHKPNASWISLVEIFLRGIVDRELSTDSLRRYLSICGVEIGKPDPEVDTATLAIRSSPSAALSKAICRFVHSQQSSASKVAQM